MQIQALASSAVRREHQCEMSKKIKPEYDNFLHEREQILSDIKLFLGMVLSFCIEFDNQKKEDFNQAAIGEAVADPVIESLRLIHGLYGYPAHDSSKKGRSYTQ
jgi:hypothetical protein